jgi:hypothetical protein
VRSSLCNFFSCYKTQQLILGTGIAIWCLTEPHWTRAPYVPVCPSVQHIFIRPSVRLSICLPVRLSICPTSVHLSMCLTVCPSFNIANRNTPHINSSVCLFICSSVILSYIYASVHSPCVCLSFFQHIKRSYCTYRSICPTSLCLYFHLPACPSCSIASKSTPQIRSTVLLCAISASVYISLCLVCLSLLQHSHRSFHLSACPSFCINLSVNFPCVCLPFPLI